MFRLELVLDAGDKAHRRVHCHHGRAPVAEKRERDADNRGDADAHADVDEGLEGHGGGHAHADQQIIQTSALESDAHDVDDDNGKQDNHDDAADHAEVLPHRGEDEVRVFACKHRGAVSLLHAGETAGSEGQLALRGLPCDAPAVRVDARIIGGDQALFLVILKEILPQQRNRRRDSRAAQREPVEPHAKQKEHGQENQHDDRGAPQVRGDDDDEDENNAKMSHHLNHRKEAVDVLMLFDIGHLPRGDDDIEDLDNLGGLDADAGEANPRLVAGAVVLAEDDQRHQQQHVDRRQQLPLRAENIRINDGEDHEGPDAEEHGEDLHRDILRRDRHVPAAVVHAGDSPVDHEDAEDGTDSADDEQEDIRPLEKLPNIGLERSDARRLLSVEDLQSAV